MAHRYHRTPDPRKARWPGHGPRPRRPRADGCCLRCHPGRACPFTVVYENDHVFVRLGGVAPCTPTSVSSRWRSWLRRTRSTGTRSSSPTWMCPHRTKPLRFEHWYRHRTRIENLFPRQQTRRRPAPPPLRLCRGQHRLDVGCPAGRHHGRLAPPTHRHRRPHHRPTPRLGWGARDGKAMITTLWHRLINNPVRLVPSRATNLAATARPPPTRRNPHPPPETPHAALTTPGPTRTRTREPGATPGPTGTPTHETRPTT
jgi:hypothetical protein